MTAKGSLAAMSVPSGRTASATPGRVAEVSPTHGAPPDGPAVDCRDLVVRYGSFIAVDGLSLQAERGQVLALLGPNGAGKTSTVETLEGYRRAASGSVRVLGLDPTTQHRALVERMGVMLQRGGIYPTMAAGGVVRLFARYYDDPEDPDALLDLVGLRDVARTPWRRLSGGEQQRLSLALAIVGRPEVVFLDEPTAGVDPEGRIAIRRVVNDLRDRGACVMLTTHELPEAERLADDVVIIAKGRAVARGTVAALAASGPDAGIRFEAPPALDTGALAAALGASQRDVTEEVPGRYHVAGEASAARVAVLAGWLAERNLALGDLRTGRRSLEEVYLDVTTKGAKDGEGCPDAPSPRDDTHDGGGST
jgi:ABC-2 type transport system ATP-binding protein